MATCAGCGVRMRCIYTDPLGKLYRYRSYTCTACGREDETLEIPGHTALVLDQPRLTAMVLQGRRRARGCRMWLRHKLDTGDKLPERLAKK